MEDAVRLFRGKQAGIAGDTEMPTGTPCVFFPDEMEAWVGKITSSFRCDIHRQPLDVCYEPGQPGPLRIVIMLIQGGDYLVNIGVGEQYGRKRKQQGCCCETNSPYIKSPKPGDHQETPLGSSCENIWMEAGLSHFLAPEMKPFKCPSAPIR